MAREDGRIMALWGREYGMAQGILDRVRECSGLSKSWILPPIGQVETRSLPTCYQNMGSRGTTNLEGKYLFSMYPYGLPWLNLDLAPEIKYAPSSVVSDEFKDEAADRMFWLEVMVQAAIEGAGQTAAVSGTDVRGGFMSSQRSMISQLIVTGDSLERMADDFTTTVFRRDQYTTMWDGAGQVIHHVIKEKIDPLTLSDEEIARVGLNKDEIEKQSADMRLVDRFCLVERNPRTQRWVIEHEINGKMVFREPAEETVSPYLSTCWELPAGYHYGVGFIELNLPDLRTTDELERHILNFAGMASKMYPVRDHNSLVQEEDLERPPGTVLTCKVQGGEPQDVGMLKANNYPDFRVVSDTIERKYQALGKAMCLSSEVIPQKERTTAAQVREIVQELDAQTGGAATHIMDNSTIPRVRRAIHILMREGRVGMIPKDVMKIGIKTGPAALARQNQIGNLTGFVTLAQQLGTEAMQSINMDSLLDVARRYLNINEPTVVKSRQQRQQEQAQAVQQAVRAQLAQAVGEKAADVVGNVAQQGLTNQLQPAA